MKLLLLNVILIGHLIGLEASESDSNDEEEYPDDAGSCGEPIFVAHTMEFKYENPGDKDQETTCIWGVYSPEGYVVSFTLMELVFGDKDIPCSSLSVQYEFMRAPASSKSVNLQIHNKGTEMRSESRLSLLVFNSRGGQSFRLILRNVIDTVSIFTSFQSNISVHSFWPQNINQVKSLTYPSEPGVAYPDSDVQILIFESKPLHKIKINVDFIDTEPRHDILSVFKFSTVEKRFLLVNSFDGHVGELEEKPMEGNENEAYIIHFQSDISNSGDGFKISFSYQLTQEIALPITTTVQPPQAQQFGSCGGFVSIENVSWLAYKNVASQDIQTCLWVLSVTRGGMLGVTLLDQTFENCTDSTAKLGIHMRSRLESSTVVRSLGTPELNVEITITMGIVLLVFQSKGQNPSFHLKLRRMGSYSSLKELKSSAYFVGGVLSTSHLVSNFTFPPFPITQYEEHSRCAIIIKPLPKKIIKLSINYVHTEAGVDLLEVFSFIKNRNRFSQLRRFSGPLGHLKNSVFQGQENGPMVLSFSADGSQSGHGFTFSYSYQNVSDNTIMTTLPPTNHDPCGSLISLTNKSEIIYKNEGGGDIDKVCIWVILGSPHGFSLTPTNFYGLGQDNYFGSLSIHYDFGSALIAMTDQTIGILDEGAEMTIEDAMTIVIYSDSNPGQGFRLRLHDNGHMQEHEEMSSDRPFTLRLTVDRISWERTGTSNIFSYPPQGIENYFDNDMKLFIFESKPQTKIKISFVRLDMESGPDFVTIYKFSKSQKQIVTLGRLTGELHSEVNVNLTFEGNENEPFFLYFVSDSSVTGTGFSFNYVYQVTELFSNGIDTSSKKTTKKPRKRNFRNRTGIKVTTNDKIAKSKLWGVAENGKFGSSSNSSQTLNTFLQLSLSLMGITICCGTIYFIFCSSRRLVHSDQCQSMGATILSCNSLFRRQESSDFHPISPVGGHRMRELEEDEDIEVS